MIHLHVSHLSHKVTVMLSLTRLTVEDIKATAARIELRTVNMVSPEPVCEECKDQVIDCYVSSQTPADVIKCWDTVGKDIALIRQRKAVLYHGCL